MDYREFVRNKMQLGGEFGFDPPWIPDFLFDFQKHLVEWACRKGRAAIFADCGLGKTPMQLTWAENVARKSGGKVLIVAPLAVAAQTQREAEKFGIDAKVSRDGTVHRLTITNYESLHKFNQVDFVGAVADESSAIKAFDGRRRKQVVRFFSKLPYRLLCTATPSPNDFIELGTQSECLGIMTQSDMLGFFFRESENMRHTIFKNDDFWNKCKYWFKPHSEQPFWRWVTSWARALRSPADIGFDGDKFVLPPLEYQKHVTDVPFIPAGELFPRPAVWLHEQREERHRTLHERCEKVAEIINGVEGAAVAWCHYNEEGDLLEQLLPGSVQVAGKDSDDWKEAAIEWFCGHLCRCQLNAVRRNRKLTTCQHQKDLPDTGRSGIKSTAKSELRELQLGQRRTESDAVSTSPNTIAKTKKRSGTRQSRKSERTKPGAESTELIQSTESGTNSRSRNGSSPIHANGSTAVLSANTESPSKNTRSSSSIKKASAPSADSLQAGEQPAQPDCTSIIATKLDESVDCSATTATTESANSKTILRSLDEPCPICGSLVEKHRVLITKPKIGCWGLNLQFCGDMTIFPSFSFEQFYQAVRRAWRFGRKGPVRVHIVSALGESEVIDGLRRKQIQAETMFASLIKYMNQAMAMVSNDGHERMTTVPQWLSNGGGN